MSAEHLKVHSAKEIKEDIDKGDNSTAGAKLFETYRASASGFKSVAEDLKKMSCSDSNRNNDVELVKDKDGDIKEIYVKNIPFFGTAFAPKLFDKSDDEGVNPAADINAWNRMATYKNHIASEK